MIGAVGASTFTVGEQASSAALSANADNHTPQCRIVCVLMSFFIELFPLLGPYVNGARRANTVYSLRQDSARTPTKRGIGCPGELE